MHSILVTGASRGIGRAIALSLAAPGNTLWIHYHRAQAGAEETARRCAEQGASCHIVQADLSRADDVTRMFAAIHAQRPVDILVNNAGLSLVRQIQDTTEDEWRRVAGVNIDAVFFCTRAAVPAMISQKWGRIVNIASFWGEVGASMETAYSATKGAVIAYTKACAKELSYSGVTVNAIAPGVVDTDMMRTYDDETIRAVIDDIPLGRMIRPEEVAFWVRQFASEEAAAVTGQVLRIDGGML
ncbi:MAG: 3-oxoacyl-ACP reductase FabG [Peptoniphilaceae bacterium]|nr:3-oxoacyl-ACP reductase FabG [Peptoniphilaceae bacterium]MDY6085129.1 3-oxoacyl-ACP reductase FabG [Peptoniphilaceae bacterium]